MSLKLFEKMQDFLENWYKNRLNAGKTPEKYKKVLKFPEKMWQNLVEILKKLYFYVIFSHYA